MPAADAQQIRALVTAVVRPDATRRAVAVRADPVWTGPDTIEGPTPVRVVACASPLAVRAALVDFADLDGEVLAILTPCADRDLGLDVLARLAKGRVLPVDPFSAVLALFGARVLDPTLVRDERWMLDDLISLAPVGGWQGRPLNGVLDVDTAWKVWHNARFGRDIPEDLTSVLHLAAEPAVATVLGDLDESRLQRLATRWAGGAAPVEVLIRLIATGKGDAVIPLGFAADVLWAPTDIPQLASQQQLGRARMEEWFGRDLLDQRSATAWADAARQVMGDQTPKLDRAEQLLTEAAVGELAVLSNELVAGFDFRLVELARAVSKGDLAGAIDALQQLRAHRLADTRRHRVLQAEAAVRVLRRNQNTPQTSEPSPTDLASLAARYHNDGAWVDEARLLLAEGELIPEVVALYAQLAASLDDERRNGDLAFAKALAEWSKSEPVHDDRIVPLEHVLERVVAKVAEDAPVLVIVGDGLSLPVAHQLMDSLATYGWARALPSDVESWPVGVAMLPTVTEVSRASLLAGERIEGGQKEELSRFTNHPALKGASRATRPPVLFHKGRLEGPSGATLPADVQAALADPDQRIVGVVLNAVDDHLSRGHQIKVTWDVDTIGPLGALLEIARDAGRVVVLTADHGHVIHSDGAMLRPTGGTGGERWRTLPPEASDDEVEVAGPRVLKGERIVLPADDRIRYGGHKHGYHGGACPQEVLVPVEVLARVLPDGWVNRPLPRPQWWTGQTESVWAAPPIAPLTPTAPSRGVKAAQPSLFDAAPVPEPVSTAVDAVPSGVDPFIARLLASPTFVSQRQRTASASRISDDRIARYLHLISENGGTIPLAALASRTGEPSDQTRMALTMVRRILNFDGTEVLGVTAANDVELNRELLTIQFDLEA